MEAFFEILIPSSRVVRANDTRDIQIHKGPLQLKDYKGNLKNWDGQLLATRFFMVSSEGNAKEYQCCCMGRYILVRDIVMRKGDESRYVYKKDDGKRSRFMYSYDGYWIVGEVAGDDSALWPTRCRFHKENFFSQILTLLYSFFPGTSGK